MCFMKVKVKVKDMMEKEEKKEVRFKLPKGQYNELVSEAKNEFRTISEQVAYIINRSLRGQTLPPQRREHDTDTLTNKGQV